MRRPVASSLTLLLAAAVATTAEADERPRLLLAPLAATSRSVPAAAPGQVRAMLAGELERTGAFSVVEAGATTDGGTSDSALAEARGATEAGAELWAQRRVAAAEERLASAREAYARAAAKVPRIDEVIDTWALSAAVAYTRGRDGEGAALLAGALAMAPERPVGLAQRSPLFSTVVAQARAALAEAPTGTVSFTSIPTHAWVTLDGRPLGATPVVATGIPPGLHLWRVRLSTGLTLGALVEVSPGQRLEVAARPPALDAVTALSVGLAEDRLSADAVAAADALGKETGAGLVLFGALSSAEPGLALDAFVLDRATGAIRRFERRDFDSELLSARDQVFALAGSLASQRSQIEHLGEPVRLPARVTSETGVAGGTGSAGAPEAAPEVDSGALRGGTEVHAPGPAAPGERRRRVPLKPR